jgi:hypothetical protein
VQVSFKVMVDNEAVVPVIYANNVGVTATAEDMTMHLGWYALPVITEQPGDADVIPVPVRPLAKVTVPLNLVRGIIAVLQNQLAQWEQNFGPLPPHPNPPPTLVTEPTGESVRIEESKAET